MSTTFELFSPSPCIAAERRPDGSTLLASEVRPLRRVDDA